MSGTSGGDPVAACTHFSASPITADALRSPDAAGALIAGLMLTREMAVAPPARVAAALAALPPSTHKAAVDAVVAAAVPGRDADRARAWEVLTATADAVPDGRALVSTAMKALVPRLASQGSLLSVALSPSRVLQHCGGVLDVVLTGAWGRLSGGTRWHF